MREMTETNLSTLDPCIFENLYEVEAALRNAIARGDDDPCIVIVDLREGYGLAWTTKACGLEDLHKQLRVCEEADIVPSLIWTPTRSDLIGHVGANAYLIESGFDIYGIRTPYVPLCLFRGQLIESYAYRFPNPLEIDCSPGIVRIRQTDFADCTRQSKIASWESDHFAGAKRQWVDEIIRIDMTLRRFHGSYVVSRNPSFSEKCVSSSSI